MSPAAPATNLRRVAALSCATLEDARSDDDLTGWASADAAAGDAITDAAHGTSDPGNDAARPADGAADASADAASYPLASWPRYTIAPGAHGATLATGVAGNPMSGFIKGVAARDYHLAFDTSAIYALTKPAQPDDQLDWNKLPGLSDCGTFDLAADGVMFGWRWRVDTSPRVLEVTAYANNAGAHLTPPSALLSLDAADLASASPLRYHLRMDGALYRFTISGTVRGRAIDVAGTLPRRCASTPPSSLAVQWAAGLYFGGTSVSPSSRSLRASSRTCSTSRARASASTSWSITARPSNASLQ